MLYISLLYKNMALLIYRWFKLTYGISYSYTSLIEDVHILNNSVSFRKIAKTIINWSYNDINIQIFLKKGNSLPFIFR